MNWEQILVSFAINTVDSFLAIALTQPSIAKALEPALLKVYTNLQQVLELAGAIPVPSPAPAPASPASPAA